MQECCSSTQILKNSFLICSKLNHFLGVRKTSPQKMTSSKLRLLLAVLISFWTLEFSVGQQDNPRYFLDVKDGEYCYGNATESRYICDFTRMSSKKKILMKIDKYSPYEYDRVEISNARHLEVYQEFAFNKTTLIDVSHLQVHQSGNVEKHFRLRLIRVNASNVSLRGANHLKVEQSDIKVLSAENINEADIVGKSSVSELKLGVNEATPSIYDSTIGRIVKLEVTANAKMTIQGSRIHAVDRIFIASKQVTVFNFSTFEYINTNGIEISKDSILHLVDVDMKVLEDKAIVNFGHLFMVNVIIPFKIPLTAIRIGPKASLEVKASKFMQRNFSYTLQAKEDEMYPLGLFCLSFKEPILMLILMITFLVLSVILLVSLIILIFYRKKTRQKSLKENESDRDLPMELHNKDRYVTNNVQIPNNPMVYPPILDWNEGKLDLDVEEDYDNVNEKPQNSFQKEFLSPNSNADQIPQPKQKPKIMSKPAFAVFDKKDEKNNYLQNANPLPPPPPVTSKDQEPLQTHQRGLQAPEPLAAPNPPLSTPQMHQTFNPSMAAQPKPPNLHQIDKFENKFPSENRIHPGPLSKKPSFLQHYLNTQHASQERSKPGLPPPPPAPGVKFPPAPVPLGEDPDGLYGNDDEEEDIYCNNL